MYRYWSLSLFFIIILLSISHPSDASLPGHLAGWTRTEAKTYTGQALFDYINGGAEIYLEYGFLKVDAGYYSKDEREILVDVYTMSTPRASAGIFSFFRNTLAPDLPPPYTGKQYDFHLECVNGSEYIKIVYYDSLGHEEPLHILRELRPKPVSVDQPDFSRLLPAERLPKSEVIFNGPIALKNFCPLDRKNFFGIGTRTHAFGCLIQEDGKTFKWVTLRGKSEDLNRDLERYVAYQRKQDYTLHQKESFYYLEDQLGGSSLMLYLRDDRLFALLGVDSMEIGVALLENFCYE